MIIITVARELGSGGIDIARQVANRLDIAIVDREIIRLAAAQAGVTERTISEMDERSPSYTQKILQVMSKQGDPGLLGMFGAQSPLFNTRVQRPPVLDSATYRTIIEGVIRGIAAQQSAIIIGRAGQIVLRDQPNALHVRIVADFEDRVKVIMGIGALDRLAAEKLVKEVDQQRMDYLKSNYKADWQDPQLYDLILNRSRLGMEGCAELIVHAVHQKAGAATG